MNVETVLHGFCVKYEKVYYNLIAPVNCFPLRAAVSTTEQLTGVTALIRKGRRA